MAIAALAADIDGKWTAEVAGRGGQTQTQTMTFKADGSTLTGTISGRGGETQISDGKVDGNTVSFTVTREFQGNSMKFVYKGTLSGNELKMTMQREGGEGQAREFTAKRSTT